MMKLIVQIPCYNEEKTLPLVVKSIPRKVAGIDRVEILIVDDGSTDKTIEVAKRLGVDHIIRHKRNKGLAKTFYDGLQESLRLGADIIVNTDGDNQYPQGRIPDLIKPILNGTHEIVVGDRQTHTIEHFSPLKKMLQRLGSWLVNTAAGTKIPDAVSGFRAYSRDAAMRTNIVTTFSYCTETIIHAGHNRIAITHIPVKTNPKTRESRLFKNTRQHIYHSTLTIFRSYTMHKPVKLFLGGGLALFIIGTLPFLRYFWLVFSHGEPVNGHVQSLLVGGILIILAFLTFALGVIADLIAINRKLHEESLYKLRKIEYGGKASDSK
jgi:glycosyltransferase involved in cell wall biosynthesis